MDLFRASRKKRGPDPYLAAKIAIFLASLLAGSLGMLILWPRIEKREDPAGISHS